MKIAAFIILIFLAPSSYCLAADLRAFLKNCAWGTLGGAAIGTVSMAFSDKPSDSWNNVAKGASLGLYTGIAYGIYQMNRVPEPTPAYSLSPQFSKRGDMEGLQMTGTLLEF